ncbi:MAG: hypothetical protein P8N50_06280, partial [Actinomycetota bacterium]|nr:hypothetical protein [Actinomycetota bacterium]
TSSRDAERDSDHPDIQPLRCWLTGADNSEYCGLLLATKEPGELVGQWSTIGSTRKVGGRVSRQ